MTGTTLCEFCFLVRWFLRCMFFLQKPLGRFYFFMSVLCVCVRAAATQHFCVCAVVHVPWRHDGVLWRQGLEMIDDSCSACVVVLSARVFWCPFNFPVASPRVLRK